MAGGAPRPYSRLATLLWRDRTDLAVLGIYAAVSSILALAVPLAAQALVNTIAAGISVQPLVVLTGAVFAGTLLAGFTVLLRFSLVEIMQQRVFARVVLDLAERVPRVDHRALSDEDPSELMNRFFDVVSIQKAWSKLALEGPGALLEVLVGLALLAFYGPTFLALALLMGAAGIVVLGLLSWGGLRTSLRKSEEKYRVAGWLEELAICQGAFKLVAPADFGLRRADEIVRDYILARRRHFGVLLRQNAAWYLVQALVSAGVLGLGGWLVIQQQLSLGQLVAAELVVITVLKASEKLVRLLDPWYDLLTALEKVGHLADLPLDGKGTRSWPASDRAASVECRGVRLAYQGSRPVLQDLDLELAPGERVCLVGANASGKTTLAMVLAGLVSPDSGRVALDGLDLRDASREELSRQVALVRSQNEILGDTLENNVLLGREANLEELREALRVSCVEDHAPWLPQGLQTPLVRQSRNLSRGQWMRIQIARALLHRPRLLILDDALAGVDEPTREELFDRLFQGPWTLLCVAHRPQIAMRADRVVVMEEGRIVESGSPSELRANPDSRFSRLFRSPLAPVGEGPRRA